MFWGAVLLLGALGLAPAVVLGIALVGARRRLSELEKETERLAQEAREVARLRRNQEALGRLLGDLPSYAARLYGRSSTRGIPPVLLEIVGELLAPRQAVVVLRRKSNSLEPERDRQLVVAASSGSGAPGPGAVTTLGEAELRAAGARGRSFERGGLDRDAEPVADLVRDRFRCDLAAPLNANGRLLGAVGISRSPEARPDDHLALRLVAQLAALALDYRAELDRVRWAAELDPLTGTLHERVLSQRLGETLFRAEGRGEMSALVLFEIDHFDSYAERQGRLAGDELLRRLAALIGEEVRTGDLLGRHGEARFLLILPLRDSESAVRIAGNIRRRVERHDFPHAEAQPSGRLTVSGGVSALPEHGLSSAELLRAAERALETARREGGNRVARVAVAGLGTAPERPPAAEARDTPAAEGEDDLAAIRGIDEGLAERLRGLGFRGYREIAELNWRSVQSLADELGIPPERPIQERWIEQARQLERLKSDGSTEPPPEGS